MEPDSGPEDAGHGDSNASTGPDPSTTGVPAKTRLSRKRTKTGCMTCRRRRIKCGEERPVCRNCVKSKRPCEGYNRRVIFKDYHAVPNGAHIVFHAGLHSGPTEPIQPEYTKTLVDHNAYPHLRPSSVGQHALGFHGFASAHGALEQVSPHHMDNAAHRTARSQQTMPAPTVHNHSFQTRHAFPDLPSRSLTYPIQSELMSPLSFDSAYANGQNPPHVQWNTLRPVQPPDLMPLGDHQNTPITTTQMHTFVYPTSAAPRVKAEATITTTPEFYEHEDHMLQSTTPTDFLSSAAVESYDDNYYDIQSDEETEVEVGTLVVSPHDLERQRSLGQVLQINKISLQDVQIRSYDTFMYGGMLDHYRVEEAANPLGNQATAYVFAHFVSVTGPSMSLFERHTRNISMLSTRDRIPFSQQGLWTYTMPMAALHHQGLLHAMLAVASLHIARLQGASVTPSIQHYAWALKRIHNNVGKRMKKRLRVTTIAATMLLGFYELMTADHTKWNTHLAGSKQLFFETDFSSMMKQFKKMKLDRAAQLRTGQQSQSQSRQAKAQEELLDSMPDIEEHAITQLLGSEVNYTHHSHVESFSSAIPPQIDLSHFEVLRDLYWWYLKQDAYQSIISGNALLLDFSRWANCAPRAPLGRADAVHGSFDHLVLLLGRIADFSARDRPRKLQMLAANYGQFVPPPSTQAPQPPQAAPQIPLSSTSGNGVNNIDASRGPPKSTSQPQGPLFYGMVPPLRNSIHMPHAYQPPREAMGPQIKSDPDPVNLHHATEAALKEYGRIRAALRFFAQSLGDAFDPLSSEYQPPMETPLGKALFYRSYDIGCLWAIYNMAVIVAIRANPHMHPAAHVAAAMAQEETRFYANEIGRIAAGMAPPPPGQDLNPISGAALTDSCLPLFCAAIQYRNADQRYTTVMRIYDIAQRTGWGSVEMIANGCETAWVKAAEAGRGPPYQRIVRRQHSDDPRSNGSWERLDPNRRPDLRDESDRRLVTRDPNARLNWAIGFIGVEADE